MSTVHHARRANSGGVKSTYSLPAKALLAFPYPMASFVDANERRF
jgi:hypothetical protein